MFGPLESLVTFLLSSIPRTKFSQSDEVCSIALDIVQDDLKKDTVTVDTELGSITAVKEGSIALDFIQDDFQKRYCDSRH